MRCLFIEKNRIEAKFVEVVTKNKRIYEMSLMNVNRVGPVAVLCFAALFVLLYLVIYKSLKFSSFFRGPTAIVVAVCVSLLSTIGVMRTFTVGGWDINVENNSSKSGDGLDIILIPYTALALSILVVLILLFLSRLFKAKKIERRSKETKHRIKTEKLAKRQDEDRFTK